MMTNLFSIFDPCSSVMGTEMNWVSVSLGLVFLVYPVWMCGSRSLTIMRKVIMSLHKEMNTLLVSKSSLTLMFLALFMVIFFNNMLGLIPYVFTATSHVAVTLSLALPLWVGYYARGWFNNATNMLAHLVPQGTPGILMPFMVLIESISSIIRPGTLAVRLAANMIAGHLLLALMSGSALAIYPVSSMVIVLCQIILLTLETAVAAIQSYVFAILSTLYASEV